MKSKVETKLKELLKFAQDNGLTELAWQDGKSKIAFRRGSAPASSVKAVGAGDAAESSEKPAPREEIIGSPVVGIFRRSSSKSRPPFVVEGNKVKHGDRLALVECMKIPTDVLSLCDGKITKILAQDGQPVEYGQPLFAVEPPEKE